MKKFIMSALAIATLGIMGLGLAACGSDDNATGTGSGGGNDDGNRSIVVMTHQTNLIWGEERHDADGNTYRDPAFAFLAHAAEEFTAQYGIEVVLEAAHTVDQLRSLLMVGDSSFDVIANGGELQTHEQAQWFMPIMTLDEAAEIYGRGMAEAMYGADGQVWGLGVGMAYSFGVSYNREVIAAAGFSEIPGDLAEFTRMLEIIRDMGVTPISLHRIENWPMGTMGDVAAHIYGRQDVRERSMLQAEPFSQGSPMGDAIYLYTQWKAQGFFEQEIYPNFGIAMDSVPHGSAAMMLFGSWVTPQLIGRIPTGTRDDVIGFDAAPDFGAGRVIPAAPQQHWFINGNSQNAEDSKLFIDFLARNSVYLEQVGVIPTHRDAPAASPEIFETVNARVQAGQVRIMYPTPRGENFLNWEEVMREANLMADERWAGLPFDAYDVTRSGDWSGFEDQIERQNAGFLRAMEDLNISFIGN